MRGWLFSWFWEKKKTGIYHEKQTQEKNWVILIAESPIIRVNRCLLLKGKELLKGPLELLKVSSDYYSYYSVLNIAPSSWGSDIWLIYPIIYSPFIYLQNVSAFIPYFETNESTSYLTTKIYLRHIYTQFVLGTFTPGMMGSNSSWSILWNSSKRRFPHTALCPKEWQWQMTVPKEEQ